MRIKIRPRQENQTFSSMINIFHSGKTAFQATHTNQCKKRINYYRPQRSCGQGNCFYRCLSVHRGGLPQCMLGCHTPPGPERHPPSDQADTPQDQGDPSGPRDDTPRDQGRPPWDQADTHPPPGTRQTPPLGPGRHHPPWTRQTTHPPPREADSSIRVYERPVRILLGMHSC